MLFIIILILFAINAVYLIVLPLEIYYCLKFSSEQSINKSYLKYNLFKLLEMAYKCKKCKKYVIRYCIAQVAIFVLLLVLGIVWKYTLV
jgi:hypothetical protein